jgi:hypothetical protein
LKRPAAWYGATAWRAMSNSGRIGSGILSRVVVLSQYAASAADSHTVALG